MNLLLISILAVASLSLLPTKTLGTTEVQETPQALPLAAQTQPTTGGGGGEIWQEDDREVLIRNERGTKNSGNGSGAGKRGKSKKTNKNIIDKENSNAHAQPSSQAPPEQQPTQKQHQQQKETPAQHQTHAKHANTKTLKTPEEVQIPSTCRYTKSSWTECDPKTNTRSRTLTLKKGEDGCVPTRTIQKKCKKACRYEKGAWSECTTGKMSRTDKLKSTSDPSCEATRVVNKNCNPGKSKDKSNDRKNKDKGARKGRP